MPRIPPDRWRPRGIANLEPNAWQALRAEGSTAVVAGPGAGKTEYLAQKAAYLLETGLCRTPARILAISFKKDAAENLAKRVAKRLPAHLAGRLVSQTFDAFTKGLVDRFWSSIPTHWRPSRPYEIWFPGRRETDRFLTSARWASPEAWKPGIASLGADSFEARHVGLLRLPLAPTELEMQGPVEFAVARWWAENLQHAQQSALTFVMLNRLAELLLRANPRIARALRTTYPVVFVDEFQDTTFAQYDFLQSAFGTEETVLTAVGDDKQRIMVWAGARTDAFARFEEDFGAARHELLFNFRSSPALVRIQQVVAEALQPGSATTTSQTTTQVDGDVAQIWLSQSVCAEATYLARWLAEDMSRRDNRPREYAVLVRQKADEYESEFSPAFAAAGLALRNESRRLGRTTLQDLLADGLPTMVLALMRLGTGVRAPAAWEAASRAVEATRGYDPRDVNACRRAQRELESFLVDLQAVMRASAPVPATAVNLVESVISFLGPEALARAYPAYATGDLLEIMIEGVGLHLSACAEGKPDWGTALDEFEGVGSVPLLTVHKSKGLEYDTIVFVGLDDSAWWSYRPGDLEGLATFFVALSRAKQRAIFAFCRERGRRQNVADLYALLDRAQVPEVRIT